MGKKVVFFSRGRGRGHAVLDMDIGAELLRLRPDISVQFVSYGSGARTFQERGVPVIDLGLPDANSIAVTTVLAGRVIGHLQPDLLVVHEEFAALPAAKIFGRKTVMITDFFGEPGMFSAESLWFADKILFIDHQGRRKEPPSVEGKVQYMGPQIRNFDYQREHRQRARAELGIDPQATVIAVFPGSWTEAMAPLADRLLPIFDRLESPKHLIWLAGQDAVAIRAKTPPDTTILETDWQIDRLMVASDLAITKATRTTVRELASLGIRTLSVSQGLNPTDDDSIAALEFNHTIDSGSITKELIEDMLRMGEPQPLRTESSSCAAALAAMLE